MAQARGLLISLVVAAAAVRGSGQEAAQAPDSETLEHQARNLQVSQTSDPTEKRKAVLGRLSLILRF
jgi:hypothetical protein